MSNSIRDTRFNNQSVAQDADEGEGQWITMHGAHVMIDDKGTIVAGAGEKFNVKTVDDIKAERKKALKQAREEKLRAISAQNREEFRKNKARADKQMVKSLEREWNVENFVGSMDDKELKDKYNQTVEKYNQLKNEGTSQTVLNAYRGRIDDFKEETQARNYRRGIPEPRSMSSSDIRKELKPLNDQLRGKDHSDTRLSIEKSLRRLLLSEELDNRERGDR